MNVPNVVFAAAFSFGVGLVVKRLTIWRCVGLVMVVSFTRWVEMNPLRRRAI
jgi:hypothetical protein